MNFIGTNEIETERLILRRLTIDDAVEAYNTWCSDDEVCKYVLWEKHKDESVTKKLYKLWEEDYQDLHTFRWIVEKKQSHELIGTIDVVSKKYLQFGTCEIGYVYGRKFWNKGYATECLKAVIKYLFEKCDAEVVYAEYLDNNPASGKVMIKAGMTYEGRRRSRIIDKTGKRNDLESCSITKEEYYRK